jgi:hypothetical protein
LRARRRRAALPASLTPPEELRGRELFPWRAVRRRSLFAGEGDDDALRGVVSRKAFLGEVIDYQVTIGGQEVRVQKGRREPAPCRARRAACGSRGRSGMPGRNKAIRVAPDARSWASPAERITAISAKYSGR